MTVGVMKTQLHLFGVDSLKGKRSIVKSVIGRLKSRFNASVAEVESNDSKLAAVLGISIVSNEQQLIDSQFDKIISFMRNDGRFSLGRIEREIF